LPGMTVTMQDLVAR